MQCLSLGEHCTLGTKSFSESCEHCKLSPCMRVERVTRLFEIKVFVIKSKHLLPQAQFNVLSLRAVRLKNANFIQIKRTASFRRGMQLEDVACFSVESKRF